MTYRPTGLRARIIDALWRRFVRGSDVAEPVTYELPTIAEQALQRAAVDLAEQYDMPVEDAVARLRSGLTAYDGEPLRVTSEDILPCDVEGCEPKREPRGAVEWDAAYRHFVEHTAT